MPPFAIAALVYGPAINPAAALNAAVQTLRRRGLVIGGALQHDEGPCAMTLEILPSGRRLSISMPLTNGVTGCRLDSAALADAAALVRQSIDAQPALAVFNKFGKQEVEGAGLCDEMAAAAASGVPLLVPVSERYLPQWSLFTGGEFAHLSCSTAAVLDWWDTLGKN